MEGNFSLITINADKVGEATKVFFEKVSDGVGGLALPWQMKRKARADVAVERIKLAGSIELDEMQAQALSRVVNKETRKQKNIEDITYRSSVHLNSENDVGELNEDWIADFFDQCDNVSDEGMQEIWARVLAGEANRKGSFSKRTISILANMDKVTAEIFAKLCSFVCNAGGIEDPFLYWRSMDNTARAEGLNYVILQQLESDGLIRFSSTVDNVGPVNSSRSIILLYHDRGVKLDFGGKEKINFGNVMFTISGAQIASLVDIEPNYNIFDEIVKNFEAEQSIEIHSSELPKLKLHYNSRLSD